MAIERRVRDSETKPDSMDLMSPRDRVDKLLSKSYMAGAQAVEKIGSLLSDGFSRLHGAYTSLHQYLIGEGRKKLEEYREVMRETLIGSKEILEKELPDMRDYLKDIRDYFYSPTRFIAKLVGAIVGASSIALAALGVNTQDGQSFFGGGEGLLG